MQYNITCEEFNFDGHTSVTKIMLISGDYPIRPCLAIFDDLGQRLIPYEFCSQYLERFSHQKQFKSLRAQFNDVSKKYLGTRNPQITLQSALAEFEISVASSDFPQLFADQSYAHLTVDFDNPWFDEAGRRELINKVALAPEKASEGEKEAFRNLLNDTALPVMLEGYQISGYNQKHKNILGSNYDGRLPLDSSRHQFHKNFINADTVKIKIDANNKIAIGFCCATHEDKLSNQLVASIFKSTTTPSPNRINFNSNEPTGLFSQANFSTLSPFVSTSFLTYNSAVGKIAHAGAIQEFETFIAGMKPYQINSFLGGTLQVTRLDKPLIAYRTGEPGRYWSIEPPASPWQQSLDLAMHPNIYTGYHLKLKPNWLPANKGVLVYEIPKGTIIAWGQAAPQHGWPGQKTQLFLPSINPKQIRFYSWGDYADQMASLNGISNSLNVQSTGSASIQQSRAISLGYREALPLTKAPLAQKASPFAPAACTSSTSNPPQTNLTARQGRVENLREANFTRSKIANFVKGLPGDSSFRGLKIATRNYTYCWGFSKKGDDFYCYMGKLKQDRRNPPKVRVIKVPATLSKAVKNLYTQYPNLQKWLNRGIKTFKVTFTGLTISSEALNTLSKNPNMSMMEAVYHASAKVYCVYLVRSLISSIPGGLIVYALAEIAEAAPDLKEKWVSENRQVQELMNSDYYKKLSLSEKQAWLAEQLKFRPYARMQRAIVLQKLLHQISFQGICQTYDALITDNLITHLNQAGVTSRVDNLSLQRAEVLMKLNAMRRKAESNGPVSLDLLKDKEAQPQKTSRINAASFRAPAEMIEDMERDLRRRFTPLPDAGNSSRAQQPLTIPIPIRAPNPSGPSITVDVQIDLQSYADHIIDVFNKEKIDSGSNTQYGDNYKYQINYDGLYTVLIKITDPAGQSKEVKVELKRNLLVLPTSAAHRDNKAAISKQFNKLFQQVVSSYIQSQIKLANDQCLEAFKTPGTCLNTVLTITASLQKKYSAAEFPAINKLCIDLVEGAVTLDSASHLASTDSREITIQRPTTKLPEVGNLSTYDESNYRLHLPNPAHVKRGKATILGEGAPFDKGDVNQINQRFASLINGKTILQVDRQQLTELIAYVNTTLQAWGAIVGNVKGRDQYAEHPENITALKNYRDFLQSLYNDICYIQDTLQQADVEALAGQILGFKGDNRTRTLVVEALIQGMQIKMAKILQSADINRIAKLKVFVENNNLHQKIPLLSQYKIEVPLTYEEFCSAAFQSRAYATLLEYFEQGKFAEAKQFCDGVSENEENLEASKDANPNLRNLYNHYLNQSLDDNALLNELAQLPLNELKHNFINSQQAQGNPLVAGLNNIFLLNMISGFAKGFEKICEEGAPETVTRDAAKDIVDMAKFITAHKEELPIYSNEEMQSASDLLVNQAKHCLELYYNSKEDYALVSLRIRWENALCTLNNREVNDAERHKAFKELSDLYSTILNQVKTNQLEPGADFNEFLALANNFQTGYRYTQGNVNLFLQCQDLYQLTGELEKNDVAPVAPEEQKKLLDDIYHQAKLIRPNLKDIPSQSDASVTITNPLFTVCDNLINRYEMTGGNVAIYLKLNELDGLISSAMVAPRDQEAAALETVYQRAKSIKEDCDITDVHSHCDEVIALKYNYYARHVWQPVTRSSLYVFENYASRWGGEFARKISGLLQCLQQCLPNVLVDLSYLPVAASRGDNWTHIFKANLARQIQQYNKYFDNRFKKLKYFVGATNMLGHAASLGSILLTGSNHPILQVISSLLDNLTGLKLIYDYATVNKNDESAVKKASNHLKKYWSPYVLLESVNSLSTTLYEACYGDPDEQQESGQYSISNFIVQRLSKVLITPKPGHLSQLSMLHYYMPDLIRVAVLKYCEQDTLAAFQFFKLFANIVTGQYWETHIQYALRDANYFLKIKDYIKGEERVKSMINAINILPSMIPAYFGYNATPQFYSEYDSVTVKAAKRFFITFTAQKSLQEGSFVLVRKMTDFDKVNDQWVLIDSKLPLTESASAMICRLQAALNDAIYLQNNRAQVERECDFLEAFYRNYFKHQKTHPEIKKGLAILADFKQALRPKGTKSVEFDLQTLIKYRNDLANHKVKRVYPKLPYHYQYDKEAETVTQPVDNSF